jgi:hypothetical protein
MVRHEVHVGRRRIESNHPLRTKPLVCSFHARPDISSDRRADPRSRASCFSQS